MRFTQITTVTVRDCRDPERCILQEANIVLTDLAPAEEETLRTAAERLHLPLQLLGTKATIIARQLSPGSVQFQIGHTEEKDSQQVLEAVKQVLRSRGARVRSHTVTNGGGREYQNRF